MTIMTAGAALAVVLTMASAMPADNVITKENGMTVINTTSLTKKVRGYMGPTPVKIYIKGKKIVKAMIKNVPPARCPLPAAPSLQHPSLRKVI